MKNTKKFWKNKKVLVTGAHGFLGSHVISHLKKLRPKVIAQPSHHDFDLRDKQACHDVTQGIDVVIHLAANVGGIGYNKRAPGSLFYDNILMGTHLLEESRLAKVSKFVGIGTICAYPKFAPVPFREEDLWDGYPEETNAPYGLAKKMMLVQSQAYRQQYSFNSIYLLPVNMYGPNDNFNPKSSHVIPALIRKFVNAAAKNQKSVTVWGSGKATREFIYAGDAAKAILLASERYNKADPINIGSGFEISIRDLANLIGKITKFNGKIVFDASKPDGQPRRKLDVSMAKKGFGFVAETNFEAGLKNTVNWYKKTYDNK